MRWCNFAQLTSNCIQSHNRQKNRTTHEKSQHFNKKPFRQCFIWKNAALVRHFKMISFDSKSSYNLQFVNDQCSRHFSRHLGTGTSFHSQRTAFKGNTNNNIALLAWANRIAGIAIMSKWKS